MGFWFKRAAKLGVQYLDDGTLILQSAVTDRGAGTSTAAY